MPRSQPTGTVIESGVLADGTPYRVWRCNVHRPGKQGKTLVYLGVGQGKRRNLKWLRKTQKEQQKESR